MPGVSLPRVPEGLRDLMKNFTKEVLREKPTNLYDFSAKYFEIILYQKENLVVRKYEPPQSYESIMKNRIRQQVPLSYIYNIIPDSLTELIKQFIKAVLKENPENIYVFAVEYFQNLRIAKSELIETTRYTAYEKYIEKTGRMTYEPKVKCDCGRILSSTAASVQNENLDANSTSKAAENNSKNIQSAEVPSTEYIKAICIIQKHVRQYLKRRDRKSNKVTSEEIIKADKKSNSLSANADHKNTSSSDSQPQVAYNVQYIKAVYIIQRSFRQYLKKREKSGNKVTKASYKSDEYLNAIYIIQRQFRRYLVKKRSQNHGDMRKTQKNYNSTQYVHAVYIIQRHFRQYMKRKNQLLISNDPTNNNSKMSLTAAAFIIQAAFRKMIKSRKDKKYALAELSASRIGGSSLNQCDEVNDNVSEAASYTSASTALLSTESAGEHIDLGAYNYEEGVLQETINEDEEVENEHSNISMDYSTETFDINEKSISSKGNENFPKMAYESKSLNYGMSNLDGVQNQNINNKIKDGKSNNSDMEYDKDTSNKTSLNNPPDIKEVQNIGQPVEEYVEDTSNKTTLNNPPDIEEVQNIGQPVEEAATEIDEKLNIVNTEDSDITMTTFKSDKKENSLENFDDSIRPDESERNEDKKENDLNIIIPDEGLAKSIDINTAEKTDSDDNKNGTFENDIQTEEIIVKTNQMANNLSNDAIQSKQESESELEHDNTKTDEKIERGDKILSQDAEEYPNPINSDSVLPEKEIAKKPNIHSVDEIQLKQESNIEFELEQDTTQADEKIERDVELFSQAAEEQQNPTNSNSVLPEKESHIDKAQFEVRHFSGEVLPDPKIDIDADAPVEAETLSYAGLEAEAKPTLDDQEIKSTGIGKNNINSRTETNTMAAISDEIRPEAENINEEVRQDPEILLSDNMEADVNTNNETNLSEKKHFNGVNETNTMVDIGKDVQTEVSTAPSEIEVDKDAQPEINSVAAVSEEISAQPEAFSSEVELTDSTNSNKKLIDDGDNQNEANAMPDIAEKVHHGAVILKSDSLESEVNSTLIDNKSNDANNIISDKESNEANAIAAINEPEPESLSQGNLQAEEKPILKVSEINGSDKESTESDIISAISEEVRHESDNTEAEDKPTLTNNEINLSETKLDTSDSRIETESSDIAEKIQPETLSKENSEVEVESENNGLEKTKDLAEAQTVTKSLVAIEEGTKVDSNLIDNEQSCSEKELNPVNDESESNSITAIGEGVQQDAETLRSAVSLKDKVEPTIIHGETSRYEKLSDDRKETNTIADVAVKVILNPDTLSQASLESAAETTLMDNDINRADEPNEKFKKEKKTLSSGSLEVDLETTLGNNDPEGNNDPTKSNPVSTEEVSSEAKIQTETDQDNGPNQPKSEPSSHTPVEIRLEPASLKDSIDEDTTNELSLEVKPYATNLSDDVKGSIFAKNGNANTINNIEELPNDNINEEGSHEKGINTSERIEDVSASEKNVHLESEPVQDLDEQNKAQKEINEFLEAEALLSEENKEKSSPLLFNNQLNSTQNLTNTTDKIESNATKLKISNGKDNNITRTSGRFLPTPIAELQLKSFKTPADAGPWYEVHIEPEVSQVAATEREVQVEHIKNESPLEKTPAIEKEAQRVDSENDSNQIISEQSQTTELPEKQKSSITFFVSLDEDNEKPNYKIPKRFLRKSVKSNDQNRSSKRVSKKDIEAELKLDPVDINQQEEKFEEALTNTVYNEIGTSKLQTIPELSESESNSELRYENRNIDDEFKDKNIKPKINISSSDINDEPSTEIEYINQEISTENIKADESIRIIQRAYRNYLKRVREKSSLNVGETAGNTSLENEEFAKSERENKAAYTIQKIVRNYLQKKSQSKSSIANSQYKKNLAAIRIQRAYRNYLTRNSQTKTLKSKSEELAAIIIQKAFRSYAQRKMLDEDSSSEDSAETFQLTALSNPSFSSDLNNLIKSPSEEAQSSVESEISKPEWFVGTTRIVPSQQIDDQFLDASTASDSIAPTESTATNSQVEMLNVDNMHGSLNTELTTIGNHIKDQVDAVASDDDNTVSNNLAGSTKEADTDFSQDIPVGTNTGSNDSKERDLIKEFLQNEIEFSIENEPHLSPTETNTEVIEEPCIKKTVSRSNLIEAEPKLEVPENSESPSTIRQPTATAEESIELAKSTELEASAVDVLDEATKKLSRSDEVIERMTQRRASEVWEKPLEAKPFSEPSFDEPIIRSMSSLQEKNSLDIETEAEDGDIIVYDNIQREDTRESSAQSDSVVFGDGDAANELETRKLIRNDVESNRNQLMRHYTIAGDDPRSLFKSVTIDDTVKYIEAGDTGDDASGASSSSFCLDDETSENIRKKMMAYSLSEADSDYFDPSKMIQDDFHIDTALADALGTSTETESTIVSAATKIQAGARGFLTRRRLRRASAGTKSSTQETKASFGNDAISESLERFIEEEAAKKIQAAYRMHNKKRKVRKDTLKSASLENSLAARRQTLQRGDAMRNDSTPDDDNSGSTTSQAAKSNNEQRLSKAKGVSAPEHSNVKHNMKLKWFALRQNSMPVQIDCEVLRIIPKHMRKRIKSAETAKKMRK